MIQNLSTPEAYLDLLNDSGCPYVDIFSEANSTSKKIREYGHRAMGFCSIADGKWYVLDPYTKVYNPDLGKKVADNVPIPFELYMSLRNIVALVPVDRRLNDFDIPKEYIRGSSADI